MRQKIAVFDFDGTLTTKDTFIGFIKYTKGTLRFLLGLAIYSPLLALYAIGLYPNWAIKQKLFAYFFKGVTADAFNRACDRFFEHNKSILSESTCQYVKSHLQNGDKLVIVSASVENWIRPFANYLGFDDVIATRVKVGDDNCLTGEFSTKNCYGREKVDRFSEAYPDRADYDLYCYGDSRGDREILEYSDHPCLINDKKLKFRKRNLSSC